MSIGIYSYGLAALAYLILTLVLASGWRGRLQGGVLLAGVGVSALWAVHAMLVAAEYPLAVVFIPTAEALRFIGWFIFLFGILRTQRGAATFFGAVSPGPLAAYGLSGLLALLPLFPVAIFNAIPFKLVYALYLGLVVGVLWLVENLFRNTKSDQRWGIKYLCFGIAGIYLYDFILYSNAVMFNQLDPAIWQARGAINALAVPLIAVSAARNPDWSLDVFVSRRMVFHTATLIGTGIYLLVMAAAGYYIRAVGGEWGDVLQIVFVAAALLGLAALLFSGHARAQLRVFFSKHFFNYQYDYREQWLRFTRTLSACKQEADPRVCVIRAVASIVDSPAGILWLRRSTTAYTPVAHWNQPFEAAWMLEAESDLVRFVEANGWVIDLQEWRERPERYADMHLPGWLPEIPQAWLIVPLLDGGELIGLIFLAKPLATVRLDWEVMDLLKTATCQAAAYLGQLEANLALTEARQFEGFHRLSAYILHDLKNIIAQQSIITKNAAKHKHNPAFIDDVVAVMEHSVTKMNRLMNLLKSGLSENRPRPIRLERLLNSVMEELSVYEPRPQLHNELAEIELTVDPDRLRTALRNIVQNAQQATTRDGHVRVSVERTEGHVQVSVSDDGIGMEPEFIQERLFRPFDTTKGDVGMGVGAYESREYIRSLGGDIMVQSQPGAGSTFRILLPCPDTEQEQVA